MRFLASHIQLYITIQEKAYFIVRIITPTGAQHSYLGSTLAKCKTQGSISLCIIHYHAHGGIHDIDIVRGGIISLNGVNA